MKKAFTKLLKDQKGIFPVIFCGCAIPAILLGLLILVSMWGGGNTGGAGGSFSAAPGEEVEFLITTYNPAAGGINGNDCGGARGSVCSDPSSPTGYTITTATGDVYTGGVAVPQDSTHDRHGTVDINQIPIPLYHDNEKDFKFGLIVPGYNDHKGVPVVDHFAPSVTTPNALDVAASPEASSAMRQYWQDNNLLLGTASNGHSTSASRVKCKIVDLTSGGGGGGGARIKNLNVELALNSWFNKMGFRQL